MSLDYRQNFISAQYLESFRSISWERMRRNFTFAFTVTRSTSGVERFNIFANKQHGYGCYQKFRFRSIFCKQIDGFFLSRFSYAFTLIRSKLWLVRAFNYAHLQQSYGLWISSEFGFCTISWEQIDGFWSNFPNALKLTTSTIGSLRVKFHKYTIQ